MIINLMIVERYNSEILFILLNKVYFHLQNKIRVKISLFCQIK